MIVHDLTRKISQAKIGLWKFLKIKDPNIIKKMVPYHIKLGKGDKIFMCTDGVLDFAEGEYSMGWIEEIKNILTLPMNLLNIVKKINVSAGTKLKKLGLKLPLDDYTIIVLELK